MKWLAVLTFAALLVIPAAGASAKDHKVDIANLKYSPAKLTIKKGDKVIWTNSDDRDHTVVSKDKSSKDKDGKDKKDKKDKKDDDAGGFDSGKIASGDKFEHTFEKTGKFEYGCDYHPRMKGVIEVTD
jgi:plastocyanin